MPVKDICKPSDAVKAHWPMARGKPVSGNDINGLGVIEKIPMTPVFWRPDGTVTHISTELFLSAGRRQRAYSGSPHNAGGDVFHPRQRACD